MEPLPPPAVAEHWTRRPPALVSWLAASTGLLLGMGLQMQQDGLWSAWAYALCLGGGLAVLTACAGVAARRGLAGRSPGRRPTAVGSSAMALVVACAAAASAWGWVGLRAGWRLDDSLAADLEGRDLAVIGTVASLPVRRADGQRFVFEVSSATDGTQAVAIPERLSLGWYGGWGDGPVPGATLAAGQTWAFTVRLKRPHGSVNPHGYDYELWLFEQGLRATGYVREFPVPRQLGRVSGCCAWWLERTRQQVRDALYQQVGDNRIGGLLAALSIGDQSAIARNDWQIFRTTGVAHLVAISGLHITMFAWLASHIGAALWRQSVRLMWHCPAPVAGRWVGIAAATAYALVAGWAVPAQRTVWMLVLTALLRQVGRQWPWPLQLLVAAAGVCLVDPWALLQPGFWLSFVAVAVLMADGGLSPGAHPPQASPINPAGRWWAQGWWAARRGARAQVLASIVLAPLSMLLFQQASVIGLVANLFAIPFVTLLLTPLALLGVLVPGLWLVASACASMWLSALSWLAGWPWATWIAAAPPDWAAWLALVGLAVLAAPVPLSLRTLGIWLVVPLFVPPVERPPPGHFMLLAADVGQGTAVLVRTADHDLLYDAGPQYSRENDAGTRVLVPLLQALGTARLDVLMLSHKDTDHVGGAEAVLRAAQPHRVSSSLPRGHGLRQTGVPHQPCSAGQHWQWDGVRFEVLHPLREASDSARPNTVSCVLRVASASGSSVLLTGDIEQAQEAVLLSEHSVSGALKADVLLVPHHGSRTSSSPALLDAVQPRWAVVQAGYRNRFGHPAPDVVARYDERRIELVQTDRCGAWTWRSVAPTGRCERSIHPRYWHTMGAGYAPP